MKTKIETLAVRESVERIKYQLRHKPLVNRKEIGFINPNIVIEIERETSKR